MEEGLLLTRRMKLGPAMLEAVALYLQTAVSAAGLRAHPSTQPGSRRSTSCCATPAGETGCVAAPTACHTSPDWVLEGTVE